MYRVDRLDNLEIMEESGAFKRPKGFDIRTAVANQPWEAGVDPELTAEVGFDADVAWWAARSLGLPEPARELTTTMAVVNRDAFVGWVLSFGASAEVIGPPELRDAVAQRVGETMAQLP
jgi:predicted DNA-binding transcriptional regulator YafY